MSLILSGFSDEYSPNFDEQLSGFNKLGIKYLELRFVDGVNVADLTDKDVDEVCKKLTDANIKVSAIGSPLGKIGVKDDFFEHLKKAEHVFKIANRLDCKYIRMFSFYLNGEKHDDVRDEVIARLTALLDLADAYGVVLCHENEAGIYGDAPETCLDLLRAFNGRLRCVFDMGNFRLGGFTPLDAYQKLKDYIEYFHVKDATLNGEIVPCGEGDAQVKDVFSQFKNGQQSKDVFVSLEPHLVAFTGLSSLASHELTQKYVFNSPAEAFTYATNNMKKIISSI